MSQFVAFGMYAFNPLLRAAWQSIYAEFRRRWPYGDMLLEKCRWDHEATAYSSPDMLFAHTCGYPLTHGLSGLVLPFCVPVFDVPGCESDRYSSHFIVGADSNLQSLSDCQGKTVAMNNPDSNSGMNVLRYSIAPLADGQKFFNSVLKTGGHLESIRAVGNRSADLAAIDAVSFQLALDAHPELLQQVRSIGFSESTGALPLVHRADDADFDGELCVRVLNEALAQCDSRVHQVLHLKSFKPVDLSHYDSIPQMETTAVSLGYPSLQ